VARRFGADVAVLLGDALLAHAVYMAAQFPSAEICRVVLTHAQVCAGEIAQTLRRGDPAITTGRLSPDYRIKKRRNYSGYRAFSEVGWPDRRRLRRGSGCLWPVDLALAYQIYDDLVDFFGEEKRIGKTLGTDLSEARSRCDTRLAEQTAGGREGRADGEDPPAARPSLEGRRAL